MIRKKWRGGEVVLSVETEDEFLKALTTSEAVELTWELGEKIGLMEDDTMSAMPRNNRTTPTPRIRLHINSCQGNPPGPLRVGEGKTMARPRLAESERRVPFFL